MQAKPQPNGNSREHFVAAYVEIGHAMDALSAAFSVLRSNVLDGRNYQHLPRSDQHLAESERQKIETVFATAQKELSRMRSSIAGTIS